MHRLYFIIVLLTFSIVNVCGKDGGWFTAKTVEGVNMKFVILSEVEKTCKVASNAISISQSGTITIPESVNGYTVIAIADEAFDECYHLTKVIIPNSITSIEAYAFSDCSSLSQIEIPNSVYYIGEEAFWGTAWYDDYPDGRMVYAGKVAYRYKGTMPNNTNFVFNEGTIGIAEEAFRGCSGLVSTTIPNSVICIGERAFQDCSSLSSIIIPQSVKNIKYGVLAGCCLNSIVVEEGNSFYDSRNNCNAIIETSTNKLVSGCKNTTIPNNTANIGEWAFFGCIDLSSITIPNSVLSIETRAFDGCKNLTEIYEETSTPPTDINEAAFNNTTFSKATLYVPKGATTRYKNSAVWGNFQTIKENPLHNYYNMNIIVSGPGSVSCNGFTIRSQSIEDYATEGASITISFEPDNGCRIKKVTLNSTDITLDIINNQYTISNIIKDTNIEVEFEAIPTTTYTLSIQATGNGTISYNNTAVKNQTASFTVNEGSSATITLTPDDGYRVKSLTVNNTDVKASISNNQYTISNISTNTNVFAEFEAIPPTTYTLSIQATGNGTISYNNTAVKNQTASFTVNEGTSATITLAPDDGYRVKNLTVNNKDVKASISNNQYTISNINANTNVVAEFEAIPTTTYTLSIQATGNGTISYDNTSIKNKTASFTVNEGSSATITLTPDDGYRIKSLTVNNTDVKASISNNQYTISNISTNTNVVAEFEAIPTTTYTLSIQATGNGTVSYDNTSIKNKTTSFTVNEGTSATITLTPDEGYRVKSLTVNNKDVKASISNNQYTINSIYSDTNIEVEFEAVPETKYTLTIKSIGNGSVTYETTSTREKTSTFSVAEGASATITLEPDGGHLLKSLVVNGTDVTASVVGNQYTISSINANVTVEVEFKAIETITSDGIEYKVTSIKQKSVVVAKGDYGQCIKVPDTVSAYDDMWAVTGFEEGALETATELAAVIWNPQTRFEEKVTNPNLLLYVKSADYAPAEVKNVIVNGKATRITLTDAASGNNFYCPEEFTAEQITYEHNYSMKTGYSTCQGWETIVLPFDVAVVNNNIGTELVPYSLWTRGDSKRPFWLYSMNEDGWQAESAIVANTPYIISMPNNDNYDATYNISGNIVFSASNATVQASENLTSSKHGHRNLVPNYQNLDSNPDIYALNVNNLWDQNTDSGLAEGSAFVRGARQTRPFEAYMTIDSGSATTRSIGIFDDDNTTGIMSLPLADSCNDGVIRVYSISGVLLKQGSDEKVIDELPKGIYVVNGKKIIK